MIHPTEDDLEEYKRQDREDKGITHLEERRRREPPIGDPCETCAETARNMEQIGNMTIRYFIDMNCPRCQGSGVEPREPPSRRP